MFCRCFGNYLLGKNIITQEQFSQILGYCKSNRVKLGLIAVEQKLLTAAKVEEINQLQMKMDKKFGDIAIEKGYLKEDELSRLLKLQGNPYLLFVQASSEKDIMTKEKVDACLVGFQQEGAYSHADMEALKNGDMEKLVTVLTKATPPYDELVSLVVKNLIRFVSTDIGIGSLKKTKEVQVACIALQEMQGDYSVVLGLACDNEELLAIANPYGREEFQSLDLDALDAVGEFINCTNGLYASKLSHENVELDMLPPSYKSNVTMTAEDEFVVLDLQVDGQWIQLILSIKHNQA